MADTSHGSGSNDVPVGPPLEGMDLDEDGSSRKEEGPSNKEDAKMEDAGDKGDTESTDDAVKMEAARKVAKGKRATRTKKSCSLSGNNPRRMSQRLLEKRQAR